MPTPSTRAGLSATSASSEDYDKVFEVARAAITQQFLISERLDAKARGQVTIAGTWFAVVQAVAATAFSKARLDHLWIEWIAIAAAAGALALIVTTFLSAKVWALREDTEIGPDGLIEMGNDIRAGGVLDTNLLLHYAATLAKRVANNKDRQCWYKWAQGVWYAAMLLPLAELGVAFTARAFG